MWQYRKLNNLSCFALSVFEFFPRHYERWLIWDILFPAWCITNNRVDCWSRDDNMWLVDRALRGVKATASVVQALLVWHAPTSHSQCHVVPNARWHWAILILACDSAIHLCLQPGRINMCNSESSKFSCRSLLLDNRKFEEHNFIGHQRRVIETKPCTLI